MNTMRWVPGVLLLLALAGCDPQPNQPKQPGIPPQAGADAVDTTGDSAAPTGADAGARSP